MTEEEIAKDKYLDHELRLREREIEYRQLNRKIDFVIGSCGAIFTVALIPVFLHALKLT
jgi:hypothetical protein